MIATTPPRAGQPKHGLAWISKNDRWAIYARDDYTCQSCGELVNLRSSWLPDSATLDHIVPRSHGGSDEPGNLRTLCRRCNARRGNRETCPPGLCEVCR